MRKGEEIEKGKENGKKGIKDENIDSKHHMCGVCGGHFSPHYRHFLQFNRRIKKTKQVGPVRREYVRPFVKCTITNA